MKKIARYTSKTQAHLATQALLNLGIKSELIGSRDYSSIIIGSDDGKYDLMIDWKDESDAMKVLAEIQNHPLSQLDQTSATPGLFLKKSIVFSLLASVFLPIVFNYVAYKNLREYLKIEVDSKKRLFTTILIIALQIPTVVVVYMLMHSFLG
jgi:hypothetical protein